jgi:hypothetical protein
MSFCNPDLNPLCYPAALDAPSITALRYLARKNTVLALAQWLEVAVIVHEAVEQTMGWSVRSGKIVLRIALQRLARHYDDTKAAEALMG